MGTQGANTGFKVFLNQQDTYYAGTLWIWGYNNNGQLGNGTRTDYSSPIQIGSLTNWSQLTFNADSAGSVNAIKTDGTLWAWGSGTNGMIPNGSGGAYSSPIQIGSLTNWSKISSGQKHTLATKTDGTLWTWGNNQWGQLGLGLSTNVTYVSPVQIGALTNWNQVSAGQLGSSFAIKTDGTLWAWGLNTSGVLGNGTAINYSSPIQIGSLTNWSKVSSSVYHTAAIKTDGTLWTWGWNDYGQLGNGTAINYSSPIQIGSLTNWSQVACGYAIAAIKTDGTFWTWGQNNNGQLGNGTTINYSSPIQVGALNNWSQVVSTKNILAIKTDGTLWGCGYNLQGELGNGTSINYSSPIQIGSLTNWNQIFSGLFQTAAIPSPTRSYDRLQDLGQRYVSKDYLLDVYPNIASATGARTAPGLWALGDNSNGNLGNGTTIDYSSPVQIGSLTNWKQVSGGSQYVSGAIKTDGTLWAWGSNASGCLGDGTTVAKSSPVQIGSLTNWKQLSVGNTSHAIETDGTLWGWGQNSQGQIGNGVTTVYSSPVQIGSLTNWKQISNKSFSGNSSAAIKTDGTLWAWGYNLYGTLGNGTTTNYSSPIQIGSLTNWKQVSSAWYSVFAIKTDGTLWTWGRSHYGQLGNGTTISYSSPIQIGSLTNWKQVAGTGSGVAAVKTDGTLWTWGDNRNGQLGNGTTISYSSPIQIGSLTNWKYVSEVNVEDFGFAIKTDGTLWRTGQVRSAGIKYSSPVQVGALTNWKSVSCSYTTLAIADGYY